MSPRHLHPGISCLPFLTNLWRQRLKFTLIKISFHQSFKLWELWFPSDIDFWISSLQGRSLIRDTHTVHTEWLGKTASAEASNAVTGTSTCIETLPYLTSSGILISITAFGTSWVFYPMRFPYFEFKILAQNGQMKNFSIFCLLLQNSY